MAFRVTVFSVSCLLMGISALEASRRPKRMIGGTRIEQSARADAPFKSILYYTWIGKAWDCFEDPPTWRRIIGFFSPISIINNALTELAYRGCPLQEPDNLVCGGALITPSIVQTACHCVAIMVESGDPHWTGYDLMTNWEDQLYVYMGRSLVQSFFYPVRTWKFVAHPQCAWLKLPPKTFKYDIGWIILDKEVGSTKGVYTDYWGPLDYAGPYRESQLVQYHKKVQNQRLVCLVIGHGDKLDSRPSAAGTLKYGWLQLLDYTNCYNTLWRTDRLDDVVQPPYKKIVSWYCTTQLQDRRFEYFGVEMGSGDSGGPVTCNNNYIALVSGGGNFPSPRAGFLSIGVLAALYAAKEANVVEWRRDFESGISGRYVEVHPDRELRRITMRRQKYEFANASHALFAHGRGGPIRISSASRRIIQPWLLLWWPVSIQFLLVQYT